jgi:hypothetical protein
MYSIMLCAMSLQHPVAPALRHADRLHVEVQCADDVLRLFGVRVQERVRAGDFRNPLEIDGALGAGKLSFRDQLEIRAADLDGEGASGIVVVRALLDEALIQMAADGDFLRRAAVAGDLGMDVFEFVRHVDALGDRTDGDLVTAKQHRREVVLHGWRD